MLQILGFELTSGGYKVSAAKLGARLTWLGIGCATSSLIWYKGNKNPITFKALN